MRGLTRVAFSILACVAAVGTPPLERGAGGSAGLSAGGREFALRLEARWGQREQAARSDSDAAAARPVLTARARTPLRVRWSVASLDKAGAITDVTVHCFLAKEATLGQRALPDLTEVVPYESALSMDFGPGRESSADFVLQLPEPGNYLLRVETLDPQQQEKSPDFAALDVRVE